jgi:type I restriction-modification system DNA methylase subunit
VLDKENATAHKGIFMVDASKGFIKDGNKNRLRAQDIHRIVDTFARQVEVSRYSYLVPVDEIADPKNYYNLNLPRYIDGSEPEESNCIIRPFTTLYTPVSYPVKAPTCKSAMPQKKGIINGSLLGKDHSGR